eukprot:jgi/Ulvmu1/12634/UM093_0027.1
MCRVGSTRCHRWKHPPEEPDGTGEEDDWSGQAARPAHTDTGADNASAAVATPPPRPPPRPAAATAAAAAPPPPLSSKTMEEAVSMAKAAAGEGQQCAGTGERQGDGARRWPQEAF